MIKPKYPNPLKDISHLPPKIRELHEYAAKDYGIIPKKVYKEPAKKVNWMRNIDLEELKKQRSWVDTKIF